MLWFVFFFFKQKTAYEMRISDWSSDVCSSDLPGGAAGEHDVERMVEGQPGERDVAGRVAADEGGVIDPAGQRRHVRTIGRVGDDDRLPHGRQAQIGRAHV